MVGPKLPRKDNLPAGRQGLKVVVCPTFSVIEEVKKAIQVGNFPLMVGSQDLSPFDEGAYTGEEAAAILNDLVELSILGHSERRQNFGESDEMVERKTAQAIAESGFVECVVAPGYKPAALEILKAKKNVRIMEMDFTAAKKSDFDLKRVSGGLLIQDKDDKMVTEKDLKVATKKKPTAKQLQSLIFAWKVAKHVKSNAIVLVKDTRTVGIGPGQTSRVESVIIAVRKAGKKAKGSLLASDAFFPKPDGIQQAAKAGVVAIIQPGGSISDPEIIRACEKNKITMVFTGMRHFRH